MKSKRSALLAVVGYTVVLGVGAARVNAITTFDVSAIMSPEGGAANCSPTCTLSGTVTIDVTAGSVTGVNITMSGETPTVSLFTQDFSDFLPGNGSYSMRFIDADLYTLVLNVANRQNLIGYNGGPITPFPLSLVVNGLNNNNWGISSGTLTPEIAAAPVPNVGAGLPGLILAGGGLLAWWRRKRKAEATA